MMDIVLSIITVSYNCEKDIINTFNSLNSQLNNITSTLLEYVVIDGGSTDNTVQLAMEETDYLSDHGIKTLLVTEPDNGIYDAMNKGLSMSTGRWVYMLNAGDLFADDHVLHDILGSLDESYDVVAGNSLRLNKYFSELWKPGDIHIIEKKMIFCHQAVFIKRATVGHHYDTKYKYCADYDLMLRLYRTNANFKIIDRIVALYNLDGITANEAMIHAYKEIYLIRTRNNVIEKPIIEAIVFFLGLIKRRIILILPQHIRWKFTKFIHRKNLVCGDHQKDED